MLPEHMLHIDGLRKEDNMMLAKKADRDKWAAGLDIRRLGQESAKVLLNVSCSTFDEDLWPVLTKAAKLLKKAGIDFGIMDYDEVCCGLRPFEMGYRAGEPLKYAESNTENWKARKVKTVVTLCSDCYQSFNVNYERFKLKPAGVEVLHITQYLKRFIKAKKLKLKKEIPVHVTYHDPCHLGRLGEPWIHWEGVERRVTEGLVGLSYTTPRKSSQGSQWSLRSSQGYPPSDSGNKPYRDGAYKGIRLVSAAPEVECMKPFQTLQSRPLLKGSLRPNPPVQMQL